MVVGSTRTGRSYEALKIVKPGRGRVVILNPDLGERLVPSMVSYLQRRLGIKTPFAEMPE